MLRISVIRLAIVLLIPAVFNLSLAVQPADTKGDTLQNQSIVKSGFADINGARIYYEEAGNGPALVLVHAGIADSRMWDVQFAEFATYYRVIRFDMRGFGKTGMVTGEFSHQADLHGLLKHFGVAKAHLIGCSKGGTTIINFALEYPEMASSLVSVAGTPGGYKFTGDDPPQWAELLAAFERRDFARAAELETQIWVDGPFRKPGDVNPAIRNYIIEADSIAMINDAMELGKESRPDRPAVDRLAEIKAPMLIIYGDLEDAEAIKSYEFLASNVDGAKKVIIKGTAHFPNMEKPGEFNKAVLDFLESE